MTPPAPTEVAYGGDHNPLLCGRRLTQGAPVTIGARDVLVVRADG